jgi:uncharacterized protein (DUF2252 family)
VVNCFNVFVIFLKLIYLERLKLSALQPISERIKQFNGDRVHEYTAFKYQTMSQNAFRFFRGTCHLFYEDLGKGNALSQYPITWICGDLHLENFGSYKGDNRLVYFDLNDFDEALLAPATWELSRIVTSIFVGFEALGITLTEATQMGKLFLSTYSTTLAKGKSRYIEPQTAKGIVKIFLERVRDRKLKVILKQRTVKTANSINFLIDNKRLFKIDAAPKKELISFFKAWLKQNHKNRFTVLDAGFRIAGTGSIGVKRYVFLLRNLNNPKKFLLADMKQAKPSSVQPFTDVQQPAWTNEAERVVAIQQRMQNIFPALLNAVVFNDEPYVIKEMQPTADKIDFLVIKDRRDCISQVIEDMAMLTASAQLRSSGRQGAAVADHLIAFGKDVHWQQSIIDYSAAYAKQVKKDFRNYARDYAKGLLTK